MKQQLVGGGASLLDAVGMERVMFSQLVCINEKTTFLK